MPVEPMPTGEFRVIQQRQPDPHHPAEPMPPSSGLVKAFDYGEPARPAGHGGVVAAAHEAEAREARGWSIGDFRLLTMLAGVLIGAGIAWTSEGHTMAFVTVAALLGAAAGESFGFGLSRWAEVRRLHVIVKRRVWFSVGAVLVLAGALVYATPFVVDPNPEAEALTDRGIALSALAIVGGLTSAATLAAVKQVVADPLPGTPGQQLDALLRLRRMCSRMMSQLGILVLLVMAVNATAIGFGPKLDKGVVLYSGVVASFVVGAMFAPTAATLRRRGQLYLERHFSLDEVPTGELIEAAENKAKLEKLLGLDQTTFGELKAGLVVLSPVVAGLIAVMIQNIK
ncbi:hypothetical protein GCM10009662_77610 [Catellatospora coxensis]|uniref:Uncharacterized protein n=1 Tax=Catellatospora coxensis TaxID=310354 RepID=A0A8J3PA63_9ACTN|nr:hypothetical protein Cco03nite_66610 [Catellatospora coxensis]